LGDKVVFNSSFEHGYQLFPLGSVSLFPAGVSTTFGRNTLFELCLAFGFGQLELLTPPFGIVIGFAYARHCSVG